MTACDQREPGFFRLLLTAFKHPFQGDGVYIIASGVVFFTVADYVSRYAGILGWFIQIVVAGYLFAFAKDVVRTSAMNEDCPPGWLDFSDWQEDIVAPAMQGLMVLALAFGLLIYFQFKPPSGLWHGKALWLAAGAWGCVSFPILFLTLAMTDSLLAVLNPLPLVRAVWLAWPGYLLLCLLCALVVTLGVSFERLVQWANHIPVLPNLLDRAVSLYLVTVLMRSIGLYYQRNHEQLQWY